MSDLTDEMDRYMLITEHRLVEFTAPANHWGAAAKCSCGWGVAGSSALGIVEVVIEHMTTGIKVRLIAALGDPQ